MCDLICRNRQRRAIETDISEPNTDWSKFFVLTPVSTRNFIGTHCWQIPVGRRYRRVEPRANLLANHSLRGETGQGEATVPQNKSERSTYHDIWYKLNF